MQIEKVSGADSDGVILDPDNYDGEINHIEIPHERARQRNETLKEEDRAILRSEIEKLLRISRIARPVAIYDASAAARDFSVGKMVDILEEKMTFPKMKKEKTHRKKSRTILSSYRVFGILQGVLT